MNEIIAIICLAGYGMIIRDLRIYLATKKVKPSPVAVKAIRYPVPIQDPTRKRGPWS